MGHRAIPATAPRRPRQPGRTVRPAEGQPRPWRGRASPEAEGSARSRTPRPRSPRPPGGPVREAQRLSARPGLQLQPGGGSGAPPPCANGETEAGVGTQRGGKPRPRPTPMAMGSGAPGESGGCRSPWRGPQGAHLGGFWKLRGWWELPGVPRAHPNWPCRAPRCSAPRWVRRPAGGGRGCGRWGQALKKRPRSQSRTKASGGKAEPCVRKRAGRVLRHGSHV